MMVQDEGEEGSEEYCDSKPLVLELREFVIISDYIINDVTLNFIIALACKMQVYKDTVLAN